MIAGNVLRPDLENPGAARRGPALLAGLLRCRRCGRKLTVTYTGQRREVLRYACHRGHLDIGEPKCISFGGTTVDEAISREALRVVKPGAVEAALLAGQEHCQQQDQVLAALQLDLKAAKYAAQRAWKQYDAVDPENRLVADELEKRWNAAMDRVRTLEHRMGQEQARSQQVTPPSTEVLRNLATDLLAVWDNPATDVRIKKRILRTLIHEVIVDIDSAAGNVAMVVHWHGGVHTELNIPRRRRGQSNGHTDVRIVEAVRLIAKICPDDMIANVLNRNGLLTGHRNRWSRERVVTLRGSHGIPVHSPERREAEGWVNLTEAAAFVGVSPATLRLAAERGKIPFEHPLPDGPWIFNRRDLQGPAIDKVVQQARRKCPAPAKGTPGQLTLDITST